ncbi:MAG: malto-oligosyltrehalose trehalohydrolase [Bryobacteraceae bacterium]
MSRSAHEPLGAIRLPDGRCRFLIWAPFAASLEVRIVAPAEKILSLERSHEGYHRVEAENVPADALYLYRFPDGTERPDPASRLQPQGVHGPSQIVDSSFEWHDAHWTGLALPEYIFYELHVGTFTPEGTFDAVIPSLPYLKDLGITAIEIMPVAQFPGSRNWGYDGVYPFAVQSSYGGPGGLLRLVDACHRQGLAVVLDVVYNHLGPEGNYLSAFGPYFTDRYQTPWGPAINFDGPYSDEVRRYFIENALYWVTDFHIDALRLDAVHAIFDQSAYPFLKELPDAVHARANELLRRIHTVPESALNDVRLIQAPEAGGYGNDAQWNDDFHHSLRTLITEDRDGYYRDFGEFHQLAKAFREGFVHSGEYSPFRRRRHGNSSADIPSERFVVFCQNHDQVGNRMLGERLGASVPLAALKLAAGLVVLSPYLPLLFMGEEYAETAPFLYFVSHTDPGLVEAVRRGRKEEFAAHAWDGESPDPQDEATFARSKLNRSLALRPPHRSVLAFYKELIRLRKSCPALASLSKDCMDVRGLEDERVLFVRRWSESQELVALLHVSSGAARTALPFPTGQWRKLLDSDESRWHGAGCDLPETLRVPPPVRLTLQAWSLALYERTGDL